MVKALITDLDGTLCDYVGIAWVRFLGANNYIGNGLFEQHEFLVEAYRAGKIDHVSFTREWVLLYGQMIRGKKEEQIEAIAKKFVTAFKKGIPEHSIQLIKHFKSKKYQIYAITASPIIPVVQVLEHIGITDVYATVPEIKNGTYTGEMDSTMHTNDNGKADIVREIIMSQGIDTSKSFALGDTIHDLPLLESVAYPIAINAKGKMEQHAKQNGFWIATWENILTVVDQIEKSGKKSLFEQMKFLYEAGMLKYTPRSGWGHLGIDNPENVAEHSFRAALIAYMLAVEEKADPYKCSFAVLMHDIGEARIGDLNKVNSRYIDGKNEAENMAFNEQVARLDDHMGEHIKQAYSLYNDEKIKDICKDADLLENLVSAREYEFKGYKHAREWIIRISKVLKTDTAKKWANALEKMDPNSWWFGLKPPKKIRD